MASEVPHKLDERSWLYRPSFPDEWERMSLLSMARWVNGLAFRDFQFSDVGKPVIKIAEIKGGITGQTKFTNQTFEESVFVRNGEMLFSWSGQPETSIDVFWWRGRDGWLNQHIFKVTPIEELDPVFFFYVLRYLKPNFIGIARNKQTTGLGHVTRRDIENIVAALPPLAEQKAIAAVLGALDDKIELNRRMNATLEAMARALFQSWFVEFDPVRAKLDGRQPAALDPATAALFPDSFQDSRIGPVPKGWKVERFDAHITADRGLSYKGEGLRDDQSGLPMHNLNSIYEGGGYKHEGIKYYAGEYRDKHLLNPGDMIVTNTEQGFDHRLIGHAAIIPSCYGSTGLYSHHIYRVRPKPTTPFSPHYLVELVNNRRWHYWISGFSNGTTINMLPIDALEMPMLVVPPVKLVQKFNAIAEAAHLQVEDNKHQSRTLATLRDTLLPKLLSGELSVS